MFQTIKNVKYFDMVSAYIFALCCMQFPMRPFKTYNQKVNGIFDEDEIKRFEKLGRCWFAKVRLMNVKIKKVLDAENISIPYPQMDVRIVKE